VLPISLRGGHQTAVARKGVDGLGSGGALRGRPLPAEGSDCFFPAVEELRRRIETVRPDDGSSVIVGKWM
jgi:hypothetical protein